MTGDDKTPPPSSRYDPFTPYYLHPSEGTGSVISPILLKGNNYDEWVRSLRNNLRAKNKLGFVDGTITTPDAKSPDYDQWEIVNSMLVAWIFNTLDVSIRKTVPFPDHVKVLWDDLRDRYSLRNGPRIHELKHMIADCKQRGRSIAEYYGELRTLWEELASALKSPSCTCSAAGEYNILLENEKLHQFLMGLDSEKYRDVASGLLMLDPLPSLSYAHGKVLSAERHQSVTDAQDSRNDVVGFAVDGVAQSRAQGGVDVRVCSHCGRKGHEKDKCFELIGWPEWAGNGGRGSRGGGRSSGRGGRGNNSRGGGRGRGGFAAAMDSTRQTSLNGASEVDRASVPTLSDAQIQQLVAALTSSKVLTSTPKLHDTRDYFVSRDVKFMEHVFPFSKLEPAPSSTTVHLEKYLSQNTLIDAFSELGGASKAGEVRSAGVSGEGAINVGGAASGSLASGSAPAGGAGLPTGGVTHSGGLMDPPSTVMVGEVPCDTMTPLHLRGSPYIGENVDTTVPLQNNEELGKGHRIRVPSTRLRDFVTNTVVRKIDPPASSTASLASSCSSGTQFNIACYVDYNKFSVRHKHFFSSNY
ncbi:hypothetical protein MRB53_024690 [Persea americana]|uniref:Uncharacterized protein n=1 Tax=Persea americana TaxID=3435 RepID=A0ACC2LE21_PERAE|nr:hypothetical protein MRB53_024690 [Persea americana]